MMCNFKVNKNNKIVVVMVNQKAYDATYVNNTHTHTVPLLKT